MSPNTYKENTTLNVHTISFLDYVVYYVFGITITLNVKSLG